MNLSDFVVEDLVVVGELSILQGYLDHIKSVVLIDLWVIFFFCVVGFVSHVFLRNFFVGRAFFPQEKKDINEWVDVVVSVGFVGGALVVLRILLMKIGTV